MRILFAGTANVAIPVLKALIASGQEIVAVVTQPAAKAGRGRNEKLSAVGEFALEHALKTLTPVNINSVESIQELSALEFDVAVVVAYGQLLRREVLELAPWLNVHFSLLPAWRGAAPVQRAIMAGDAVTGVSVFQLDEGMDTGPVFGYVSTDIRQSETAAELLERLSHDGAVLMVQILEGLQSGRIQAVAQSNEGVSHAAKLSADDAKVNWGHPALIVDRLVRGCTTQPGAWTQWDGQRLGIEPVKLRSDLEHIPAGEVHVIAKHIIVGTGSHPVELTRVKPAGKNWMPADAWLRGIRTEVVFS